LLVLVLLLVAVLGATRELDVPAPTTLLLLALLDARLGFARLPSTACVLVTFAKAPGIDKGGLALGDALSGATTALPEDA
jgi:hypothetical protein